MDINSIIASEINKNAAVNTFTKGMNTDTADNMMPGDQYRMAKNLRVITNDGNSNGELRLIDGMSQVISGFDTILATTLIRDYGIVIYKRNNKWWIFRIDNSTVNPTCIFGGISGCSDPIGEKLSLVTRYEDEDNIKLYIADGLNSLMMINISPLADATRWQHSDIAFLLSSEPHVFGGFSNITQIANGTLKPAVVQYAYVLYNKFGKSSNLSPLSKPNVISKHTLSGYVGVDSNSVGSVGYSVEINENNSTYERIKIYRITYRFVGQDPEIDLICDDKLTDTNYIYTDKGISLMSISYSEFLSRIKMPFIPNEIESKNDWLFASNIQYKIGATQDVVTKFSNLDMSCQVQGDSYLTQDTNVESSQGTYTSFQLYRTLDGRNSLRRGEIYRYGIVLYDKYENAWPVKFLCDIHVPKICMLDAINGTLYNLAVRFTIDWQSITSDLGQEFGNFFKSFEIVRCNRTVDDRFTITQGIIGRPFECYKYTNADDLEINDDGVVLGLKTDILCPTGFMTTDRIIAYHSSLSGTNISYTYGVSSDDYLIFASPETCYQLDDILNIIKTFKSNLLITPVWQGLGVLKNGHKYIQGEGVECNTKYRKLDDGSIPGLTFLSRRMQHGDGFQPEQSADDIALWVGTRYFPYIHEPLGYHQGEDVDTEKYATNSTYDQFDVSPGDEFETKNGVEMRKTIFNYFNVPFNPVSNAGYSKDTSLILGTYTIGAGIVNTDVDIADIKNIQIPEYYQYSQSGTPTFRNNTTVLGSKTFIPWSIPTATTIQDMSSYTRTGLYYWELDNDRSITHYPISSAGKGMLIKTSRNMFDLYNTITRGYISFNVKQNLSVTVCNIKKRCTPYGGFSDNARQQSTYYSFGNYSQLSNTNIQINVQDGDCFIQLFRYNAAKTLYTPETRYAPNMTTIYVIPLESDIDMDMETGWSARHNDEFEDNKYIQDTPAKLRGYTQEQPCYVANTAYNTNQTARFFTGQDEDSIQDNKFDYRILYSNQKLNNETEDSWLTFKSANYIDVDTRYGQVTNLRAFKDTLLFWQEHAAGVLSVNERTMLQDTNDTNIILGNGDVLQRYDYLTTEYGMKPNQFADGQSNTTLYWWDGHRKEIVSYAGGNAVMPMNKVKTIDNYINGKNESTKPTIAHDVKYNEMLFNVVDNSTLAYSEVTQHFMSVYDVAFTNKMYFNNRLILADNDKLYEWNKSSINYTFKPYLKFVITSQSLYNNTYDLMQIGGELYDGQNFNNIQMKFKTPSGQEGRIINGKNPGFSNTDYAITNREYDFRLAVPRAGHIVSGQWTTADWGDRLRGKTMECELSSTSSDHDFSLQYIITKYRKSWI